MKVTILGCSGGIGLRTAPTTALRVDDDILVDAGTGVLDLSLAELRAIDHIFLTHAHLDHTAALPLLLDSVSDARQTPVTVHALPETIQALQQHIFNWVIWPDFADIRIDGRVVLQYQPIQAGERREIMGREFIALPATHTVPAAGYSIGSGRKRLVYTGDTTVNDETWSAINTLDDVAYLLVESAFPDQEEWLAVLSKHLCPRQLGDELRKLTCRPEVFITHLKPGHTDLIRREVNQRAQAFSPQILAPGQVFAL